MTWAWKARVDIEWGQEGRSVTPRFPRARCLRPFTAAHEPGVLVLSDCAFVDGKSVYYEDASFQSFKRIPEVSGDAEPSY